MSRPKGSKNKKLSVKSIKSVKFSKKAEQKAEQKEAPEKPVYARRDLQMTHTFPVRGLWCVAKDLSWVVQSGCNREPLKGGTFVMVIGKDEVEAKANAVIRIETIARNLENTRKVLGHD